MCDGLLHGNSVTRWVPHFESWSALVQRVCQDRYNVQLNGAIRIAMLMDCNGKETTTPGTGPMTDIPGAPTKYHGIKAQILTAPTGNIINVFGPGSLRENDIWYKNESEIDEYLYN
eukprot:scaffold102109_cov57-Attheya_sp.AAC.1